jgi:hypothetical protein
MIKFLIVAAAPSPTSCLGIAGLDLCVLPCQVIRHQDLFLEFFLNVLITSDAMINIEWSVLFSSVNFRETLSTLHEVART